jgi:hypothetical protein
MVFVGNLECADLRTCAGEAVSLGFLHAVVSDPSSNRSRALWRRRVAGKGRAGPAPRLPELPLQRLEKKGARTSYALYTREGDHSFLKSFAVEDSEAIDGCSDTDGIEVVSRDLGPANDRV